MTTFQIQLTYTLGNRVKCLPELKKTFVRPLIQIAVKALELEHIEEGILDRVSKKYNIPEENIDEYYAAIFDILTIHFRSQSQPVKMLEFKQTLEELKVSSDCIDDLAAVIYGQKQSDILMGVRQKAKFYPNLISCRWRIDITISSSTLNRALEPRIIMEWIFDTGEHRTFELSLPMFHQLRHAVASILMEIQILERHTLLKNIQCN